MNKYKANVLRSLSVFTFFSTFFCYLVTLFFSCTLNSIGFISGKKNIFFCYKLSFQITIRSRNINFYKSLIDKHKVSLIFHQFNFLIQQDFKRAEQTFLSASKIKKKTVGYCRNCNYIVWNDT